MGWVKENGKPIIYTYKNGGYTPGDPHYFTWETGHLWMDKDSNCIKFINDTKTPLKIGHVGIKTVSCHSGGSGYWAFGGYMGAPGCKGYGGTYTCYIRVSNDGGKTFEQCPVVSGRNQVTIPAIDSSNMNTPGSGGSSTAKFGDPPFTGYKGLQFRNFEIDTCPIIQPGGIAYIHLKVDTHDGRDCVIRFILDTDELDVGFEPGTAPYIWRYCEDGKWHLRKPLFVSENGKWNDPEDE